MGQMIEFYLILLAVQPNLGGGMFWRLMVGTVAMLAFGYAGESRTMDPVAGFAAGMAGWFYILYEIFSGEAGKLAGSDRVNKHVAASFGTMRFIVTVGWSIYPLGYFFGYLQGAVSAQALNLVYNLADFLNKIGFCLAIWASAKRHRGAHGQAGTSSLSEWGCASICLCSTSYDFFTFFRTLVEFQFSIYVRLVAFARFRSDCRRLHFIFEDVVVDSCICSLQAPFVILRLLVVDVNMDSCDDGQLKVAVT